MPAAPIRGISFNEGGLELIANGFVVGGLGVSGTPDGKFDQECAFKGHDAAQNLLK
jgi:uncharacterized protein GlcG (DUF336 family)